MCKETAYARCDAEGTGTVTHQGADNLVIIEWLIARLWHTREEVRIGVKPESTSKRKAVEKQKVQARRTPSTT